MASAVNRDSVDVGVGGVDVGSARVESWLDGESDPSEGPVAIPDCGVLLHVPDKGVVVRSGAVADSGAVGTSLLLSEGEDK